MRGSKERSGNGRLKTHRPPRDEDAAFMAEAIKEAGRALRAEEVPVGAVITLNGSVIAKGYNRKESSSDPTAHAEMAVIRKAAQRLRNWRLSNAVMYVTLEPCLMCMGAIIQARLARLVFAAFDPKAGACGSLYDLSVDRRLNHRVEVTTGIGAKESADLLKTFFSGLRGRAGRSAGR
jgi:tRNA(adenine34) deaminase